MLLSALFVSSLLVPTPSPQSPADDPKAEVFLDGVPKRPAPDPKRLEELWVLSAVPKNDPYRAVVDLLPADRVVDFDPEKLDRLFKKLAKDRPGNVAIVCRPDQLDVHLHFEFVERAARIDSDPFVDFTFGYFTGATAEEAVAFAQGALGAVKREGKLTRSILEFGPSSQAHAPTSPVKHKFAKKFKSMRYAHPEDAADAAATLGDIDKVGIYQAWGHGMPDGVSHGISGAALRKRELDLHPSLYFSGPCYCGVTGTWFDRSSGATKAVQVAPEDSFLLALLAARPSAVFAGLDPDRGESSHHEIEHMLCTGDSAGLVMKSTYDEVVMAYRARELELPRYELGQRKYPYDDIHDQMASGGACRALFGLPTFEPYSKAADDPFAAKTKWKRGALRVTWKGDDSLGKYWSPVEVFRAGGGWTHRVKFRVEVDPAKASKLKSFRVASVTRDGDDLEYVYPTAALEAWGDRVYLHGVVVFPAGKNPRERALWGGKEYRAEFEFGR